MRLSARTFAAMLTGLALAAFMPEMDAQSRSGLRTSGTVYSRSSGQSSKPAAKPASKPAAKPSSNPKPDISPAYRNPSRPSVKPPQSGNKPSARPDNRPSPNKPSAVKPAPKPGHKPAPKPGHKPGPKPDYRPGNPGRPIGVRPPAARPHKPDRPPVYRPIRPRPYVRPVIIRPSYGSVIAADIAAGMAWTAVNIAYFNTVARTYDQINDNSAVIAQQNAVIAQNNATIAAQNQAIAQSDLIAQQAYGLANGLGLVQSYADAGASYFYQDGVFYTQGTDGQYYVIVPPAGALVETLPEDFEAVVLGGKEYYKVGNTIYKMTINEGKPYFEVVGQMN